RDRKKAGPDSEVVGDNSPVERDVEMRRVTRLLVAPTEHLDHATIVVIDRAGRSLSESPATLGESAPPPQARTTIKGVRNPANRCN
ncbi:MAG: hypothetical protein M3132_05725, partial [Actinomycetia bacterium]|nr:hypothetical protein [Actinomycetes bacterium]